MWNWYHVIIRHITIQIHPNYMWTHTTSAAVCFFSPCLNRRAKGLQGLGKAPCTCWSSHPFSATPTSKANLCHVTSILSTSSHSSRSQLQPGQGPRWSKSLLHLGDAIGDPKGLWAATNGSSLHGEPFLFSGSVSESLHVTESLVGPHLHVHHTKVMGDTCPGPTKHSCKIPLKHVKTWTKCLVHSWNSCIFLPISQQIALLILDSISRPAVDLSFHKMSYLWSAHSRLPASILICISGCLTRNSQLGIPKGLLNGSIFIAFWMFHDLPTNLETATTIAAQLHSHCPHRHSLPNPRCTTVASHSSPCNDPGKRKR